jgi:hypothetical protein
MHGPSVAGREPDLYCPTLGTWTLCGWEEPALYCQTLGTWTLCGWEGIRTVLSSTGDMQPLWLVGSKNCTVQHWGHGHWGLSVWEGARTVLSSTGDMHPLWLRRSQNCTVKHWRHADILLCILVTENHCRCAGTHDVVIPVSSTFGYMPEATEKSGIPVGNWWQGKSTLP